MSESQQSAGAAPVISLIVAMAENGIIGADGDLPWHLPADLRRFKRLTMGHHLLLGRKTFDSIGKALPGRRMIVLSRGAPDLPEGVDVAGSLDEAIDRAVSADDEEIFVAGGAELYRGALPRADRLYLTRVHADVDGDVSFPEVDWHEWVLESWQQHAADGKHKFSFTFEVYGRKQG